MKRKLLPAAAAAAAGTLALPASALADSLDAANSGGLGESVPINTLWVVVSAIQSGPQRGRVIGLYAGDDSQGPVLGFAQRPILVQ